MRTHILVSAAFMILAGCGKPAAPVSRPEAAAPQVACNQVVPNVAIPAMLRGASVPAASLPALPGGQITPGLYDLASGEQFDGAPSWEDTRSVSLQVTNGPMGTLFQWAQLAGPNQATRSDWTAQLQMGPSATLSFTCGRTGSSPLSYASTVGELHLRMPDPSGTGTLDLAFIAHKS